jgi:3-oxoacyl-[acyl-carrier protein] reductase
MKLNLEEKVVLVTGASKGIGRAIAETCAAEGATLALCARSEEDLSRAASELSHRFKIDTLPVAADLSSLAGVQACVGRVVKHFSRIDILVNVAGAIRPGTLLSKPDADWLEDYDLKLFGYVRMMREVFPLMKKNGGRIINIIGSAGRVADPAYIAGGGANAALMNITKAAAVEGGPHNILINGINPGPTRTERWDTINSHLSGEWGLPIDEVIALRLKGNPLGRPADPASIAAMVAFLASSRAADINGAIIEMDGGSNRCL